MGQAVDVYVVDEDENPVSGVKVKIWIPGFWKGGSLEEFTDDEGHAEFETSADYEDSREVNISVRGQSFGPYTLSEGRFTVQLE